MTPDEFRQAGHQLIDWIADYRSRVEEFPVRENIVPGEIKRQFGAVPDDRPAAMPEKMDALVGELDNVILPGITHVLHPMSFGWFPSNSVLSSVLGDIASSGIGSLGISWESSPALTEVEEAVCDWMRQLTGLSEQWQGTIHDTASTACLTALLVAREQATQHSQMSGGLQGYEHPLTVYATAEAHSSVTKAALLAGYGKDNLRWVDTDPTTFDMSVESLTDMIRQDIANGFVPCAIIATAGSTGVTAFDPIDRIAEVSKEYGTWLHVDAAMAGNAMLLPECRHLWTGVEQSDSICWNPHKWMGTALDFSLFYVRNPQQLVRVMSTNPSYLRSAEDGRVTQYRDWGIPLGRRFRALKLLFQLRLDGPESIRQRIRRDIDNARWFAGQVESAADWEVLAPVRLQTVCIRHRPHGLHGDALDRHTLDWVGRINRSGQAFLTAARLRGRWMVRVSVGSEKTTQRHVAALWSLIQDTANLS